MEGRQNRWNYLKISILQQMDDNINMYYIHMVYTMLDEFIQ